MKQAYSSAASFISELISGATDVRLEEISSGPNTWDVVISYSLGTAGSFSSLVSGRVYKHVEVSQETGEPVALRVWKA